MRYLIPTDVLKLLFFYFRLDDRRGSKRPFDGPRKDLDFWDDRKRGRREPSLDPADR